VTGAGDARPWRVAVGVTIAASVVRLFFAARLPLFPDETYYWDWSRQLSGGYFDHPPMIAVLIRAGHRARRRARRRPTPLAIRFFPCSPARWHRSPRRRRRAHRRRARSAVAALAFAVMPLAAAGLVLATPTRRSCASRRSPSTRWCVRSSSARSTRRSVVVGGGRLRRSRVRVEVHVDPAAALGARGRRGAPLAPRRLREPGPYVACVLATLVFLPVLRWNAMHDWISFRFQLEHGLGRPKGSALMRELDLVGGQLGS
jgi:hypothetical protein